VFILERYFVSKPFCALREAFNNACHETEVPNKTTIHRLVTKFRTQEVFICDKRSSSDKAAKMTAVPISSSASAAATGCGCRNPYSHWFCSVLLEGANVKQLGLRFVWNILHIQSHFRRNSFLNFPSFIVVSLFMPLLHCCLLMLE
jgi:hypothetical protein